MQFYGYTIQYMGQGVGSVLKIAIRSEKFQCLSAPQRKPVFVTCEHQLRKPACNFMDNLYDIWGRVWGQC